MNRSERITFLRYGGLVLSIFVLAIVIQFNFILDGFNRKFLILPILVSVIISSLFGYAAVLRQRLYESNQAKGEFLSRMSHELRTPLNAVLGFAQLIKLDASKKEDPILEEHADEISTAGVHLLDLIDDLLDLSRIEAGKVGIEILDVNLNEIINECLTIIDPLAKSSDIEVTVADICMNSDLKVKADRIRIKEVLLNLLSNAVKYNKQNGWVLVSCHVIEDNRIRLTISDSGCGISAHDIDNIFVPFSRGSQDEGEIKGVGIGLGITRKLVELMGGEIGCESEVNKGSTFWVTLVKS